MGETDGCWTYHSLDGLSVRSRHRDADTALGSIPVLAAEGGAEDTRGQCVAGEHAVPAREVATVACGFAGDGGCLCIDCPCR